MKCLGFLMLLATVAHAAPNTPLAITDVTIITMEEPAVQQGTLLIEDGRIKAIEPAKLRSIQGAALYRVEQGLIKEMLFLPRDESVPYPKEIGQSGNFNLAKICRE